MLTRLNYRKWNIIREITAFLLLLPVEVRLLAGPVRRRPPRSHLAALRPRGAQRNLARPHTAKVKAIIPPGRIQYAPEFKPTRKFGAMAYLGQHMAARPASQRLRRRLPSRPVIQRDIHFPRRFRKLLIPKNPNQRGRAP